MTSKNRKFKIYSVSSFLLFVIFIGFVALSWQIPATETESTSSLNTDTAQASLQMQAPDSAISFGVYVNEIYETARLANAGLALPVFEKAMTGFVNLKNARVLSNAKDVLTVVDFTRSSKEKRMWIIDLKSKSLLLNTFVAHGQGSGDDMANKFSNVAESHQSSLGFYLTNETYFGKHGLSLRLDGMDKDINSKARNRAIVVHGADYVSQDFINTHGRLGRSFGCPAVPVELNKTVINLIKDKTCLFINGKSSNYNSEWLNQQLATETFSKI